jgi:hypothetical protein
MYKDYRHSVDNTRGRLDFFRDFVDNFREHAKTQGKTIKNMAKNSENLQDWWPISSLAREIGVPRSTLMSACLKNFVKTTRLGDGLIVASKISAEKWDQTKDSPIRRAPRKAAK